VSQFQFQAIIYEKKNVKKNVLDNVEQADKLNAQNMQMRAELVQALQDAAKDNKVRAIVITGAGRAFSAGADISKFPALTPADIVK